jgi:serine/threonine-protein kinase
LSFEGAVKLLDFGIAKALGDSPDTTKSGTLKGKYAYMAPEQTEGDNVDHRIDIFAAGIVLYEVLTGRRLFKGSNDLQTIERVRRCEVKPPSLTNPACPPEMDAILLKALSRDRDDRYQDAAEMADALDEIVHASHFTAPRLSAILRETFGSDISSTGSFPAERRPTASSSVSTGRSATIPPVSVSQPRPTGQFAAATADNVAAAAAALAPRPLWKRGSFWAVAALCAGGVGLGVMKGVIPHGMSSVSAARPEPSVPMAAPGPAPASRIRRIPILLQSDPEGADIFVSGKLESLGVTPKWVNLEIDSQAPTRVMFRKNGFQDKAVAIESERPPLVHLMPTSGEPPAESPADKAAAARARAQHAAPLRRKKPEAAAVAPEVKPAEPGSTP